MNLQQAIIKSSKILQNNAIPDAGMVAKILLAHMLNIKREELITHSEMELDLAMQEEYFDGIYKIAKGYPLQYLTHTKEFMNMRFYVDEGVLVPRADTEVLVEEALKIAKPGFEILDLCTGSGAISVSLAKYGKDVHVTASDISDKALEVAKKNAKELLNDSKINFIKSDMFENIDGKFDIIVSNPPYIRKAEIANYSLQYEPQIALDGGEDGLKFYKVIISETHKYLKTAGYVMLEIGFNEREEVEKLIGEMGQYKDVYCVKDLGGNDRVIVFRKG